MTAPVLRWAARTNAPPPPTWIHVHCQQAPKERPEHVCFLGEFEELHCHFLKQTRSERGRSEPCTADHENSPPSEWAAECVHCAAGTKILTNFYAPALIHNPGNVVKGKEVWVRVVYYVPTSAIKHLTGGTQRGKLFACWRVLVGSVQQFRSRYLGYAHEVDEPTFDVRPFLQHLFAQDQESASAVKTILTALPPTISPPRNKPARRPDEEPISHEDAELARKLLADHKAKQRPALSPTEADLLSKRTGELVSGELRDALPDGHPAKQTAKRKGGAA